ncbi:MAG: hypothetical protein ACOC41_05545 [Chitinivibrionales bacterium]
MSKAFVVLLMSGVLLAQDGGEGQMTENKNVTIVSASSTADGKHRIAREIVEECIISLPAPDELHPQVSSRIEYLHHIDGKKDNDRHVKVFEAEVAIHYLVRQKEILIVTANTVPATEPVIKEVEKTVRKSHLISSDPGDGEMIAERSPRRTFFPSAESAAASAKKRARIWLSQHQNVICP